MQRRTRLQEDERKGVSSEWRQCSKTGAVDELFLLLMVLLLYILQVICDLLLIKESLEAKA